MSRDRRGIGRGSTAGIRWTARAAAACAALLGATAPIVSARDATTRELPAPDLAERRREDPPIDARALFLAHCASCHGETGDGEGVSELDRPARSFRDGGFSFGNTPETIARTIAGGIPGTPMPGFVGATSAAERDALARYVISLGPPELPAPRNTELVVRDRPLVARGKLPPIVRGAPERPRGLLVGTLDGLTFEYDAGDVRLLGVRQGRFVDRRDWADRGGSALQPLGQLVHVLAAGRPPAPFSFRADGEERAQGLVARLARTSVQEGAVTVETTLRTAAGTPVARVRETPRLAVLSAGSGYVRRFEVEALVAGELGFELASVLAAVPAAEASSPEPAGEGQEEARNRLLIRPFEPTLLLPWSHLKPDDLRSGVARVPLAPGGTRGFELMVLPLATWDDEMQGSLLRELER